MELHSRPLSTGIGCNWQRAGMKKGYYASPPSSPPTPPSPLPISVGPGNQRYNFSSSQSPSASPPFSPPPSGNASAENLPLLNILHQGGHRERGKTGPQILSNFHFLVDCMLVGKALQNKQVEEPKCSSLEEGVAADAEVTASSSAAAAAVVAAVAAATVAGETEVDPVAPEGEAAALPISCAPEAYAKTVGTNTHPVALGGGKLSQDDIKSNFNINHNQTDTKTGQNLMENLECMTEAPNI
ncbi:hypothetical protein RJ639_018562 [Escallonia herrerae]|uniref:Uncharacterized protein n=1 Tax=Escallonia herrerae TaxID=1293975 RepID=A0AA88VCC1_9ASTE|nr:hypothetical protein RJ639_018562 [Escallonia herrerae]